MADNQHFQYIIKLPYFKENLRSKLWLKAYSYPRKGHWTLDLEYQDGGDELQNLITETTAMRDPGLFISVMQVPFDNLIWRKTL